MASEKRSRSDALMTDLQIERKHARSHGVGASGGGRKPWVWQRATAIVLLPLVIWLFAELLVAMTGNAIDARAWLSQPHVAILLAVVIAAALYHMVIGLESIEADYVHTYAGRTALKLVVRSLAFAGLLASWVSLLILVLEGTA